MFLNKLELKNYRNYEDCEVDFTCNKTILVGKNAQGKTNLLEAIYYLATLSSIRTTSDAELISWNKEYTRLKAEVTKYDSKIKLDIFINPPKPKLLKVNNLKKNKYFEFLSNIVVVIFSVADLLLLRGNPSDRRNWIDNAISQLYPGYKERLQKYNKIRVQRNNLLKSFNGNINVSKTQSDLLSTWNNQITISGSNLIHLRQKYLKEIQQIAFEKHKHISSSEENLIIKYKSTITGIFDSEKDNILSPDKIVDFYNNELDKKHDIEIIRAQTLIGPHRDDISFFINEIDAESYASQGQQRSIVLSLKLAELNFIKNIINDNPILLLDDVLAELDSTRQNFLLSSIPENIQTIITAVDISSFEKNYLKDVKIFIVKSGKIEDFCLEQ